MGNEGLERQPVSPKSATGSGATQESLGLSFGALPKSEATDPDLAAALAALPGLAEKVRRPIVAMILKAARGSGTV